LADLATPASIELVEQRGQPLFQLAGTGGLSLLTPVAYSGGDLVPAFASGEIENAKVQGLVVQAAAAGRTASILKDGRIWLPGTPLTTRGTYVLSHNSGKICLIADIAGHNSDILSYIGFAESTSILNTMFKMTGVRNGVGGGVAHIIDNVTDCTVTTARAHGLTTGASVTIDKTGTGYDIATNGPYTVTVVDTTTFTLGFTLNAAVDLTNIGIWYV
jgi:hypothetical protein